MTDVIPASTAPMANVPDLSHEFDRGPQTSALRDPRDHRTHIDRICPYLPGESYAGAGGNAVVHMPAPVPVAEDEPPPLEAGHPDSEVEFQDFDASA